MLTYEVGLQAQLDEVCLGDLFVLVHVLPGCVLLYVNLRPEAGVLVRKFRQLSPLS
jgi:hypothetical protein